MKVDAVIRTLRGLALVAVMHATCVGDLHSQERQIYIPEALKPWRELGHVGGRFPELSHGLFQCNRAHLLLAF